MVAPSYAPKADVYVPEATRLLLPNQVGMLSLASTFRETALGFMNESAHWGKAELAMWLMGPYSRCIHHGLRSERQTPVDMPLLLREIDARFVDRMIAAAHHVVLDIFRTELSANCVGAFALDVVEAAFVSRCQDTEGQDGWLPTTAARRLADRVLSLFAADYLTRPTSFESELSVCRSCGLVAFDVVARSRGICDHHGSGFFGPRRGLVRDSLLPEGA